MTDREQKGGAMIARVARRLGGWRDVPTGSMDAERWAATVELVSAAHGLAPASPHSVHQPALAGAPAQ